MSCFCTCALWIDCSYSNSTIPNWCIGQNSSYLCNCLTYAVEGKKKQQPHLDLELVNIQWDVIKRSQQWVNKDPIVHRKVRVWSSICSLTLTPTSNHPQLCVSVFKLFYPERLRAGCLCMHRPAPNRQEVKGDHLWPLSISVDSEVSQPQLQHPAGVPTHFPAWSCIDWSLRRSSLPWKFVKTCKKKKSNGILIWFVANKHHYRSISLTFSRTITTTASQEVHRNCFEDAPKMNVLQVVMQYRTAF